LVGEIEEDLKSCISHLAEENEIKIIEIETDKDHIHMLIECKPQHYIPNMMKSFKGVSAKVMFRLHPELKSKLWGGHLWNPSYFIATVSENTETQIKEYIQNQKIPKPRKKRK
jgi:putative transposase